MQLVPLSVGLVGKGGKGGRRAGTTLYDSHRIFFGRLGQAFNMSKKILEKAFWMANFNKRHVSEMFLRFQWSKKETCGVCDTRLKDFLDQHFVGVEHVATTSRVVALIYCSAAFELPIGTDDHQFAPLWGLHSLESSRKCKCRNIQPFGHYKGAFREY